MSNPCVGVCQKSVQLFHLLDACVVGAEGNIVSDTAAESADESNKWQNFHDVLLVLSFDNWLGLRIFRGTINRSDTFKNADWAGGYSAFYVVDCLLCQQDLFFRLRNVSVHELEHSCVVRTTQVVGGGWIVERCGLCFIIV